MKKEQQINELGVKLIVTDEVDEDLLAAAYLRWKVEGLLPVIFHQAIPSLTGFLSWHHIPSNRWLGCFAQPLGTGDPVLRGIGWLSNIQRMASHVKAEVGHGFFRKVQPPLPLEFCEMMLDYTFQDLGVDVLHGATPEENVAALRFLRKIGFKEYGPIPMYSSWQGKPSSVVISCLTKEMWEGKYGRT